MHFVLRPFRLVAVALLIIAFLMTMSLLWLFVRERWARVRLANRVLTMVSPVALALLAVHVEVKGAENIPRECGALLVGNHLSYIDVVAVASQVPVCFVTSTEIKNSLGLGQICQMAGCLFVNRKNKRNLGGEVEEIRDGLSAGLKVAIFPEATSTNGEQLLRFRKPLYLAATGAAVPIVPFCLNYREVGHRPIDVHSRDDIFWYGDMDFMPHLWRLAGRGHIRVELNFLKPLPTTIDSDTTVLAEASQSAIEKVFIPIRA